MVAQIPYGKVATYGQIALYLGHPRAARTVGWALHALPEGTETPWHRVINSQGRVSTSCLTHSADLQRAIYHPMPGYLRALGESMKGPAYGASRSRVPKV